MAVEAIPFATVRALAFGLVPVGKTSTQDFTVTNRLSERAAISSSSDSAEFGLIPATFTVDPLRSRTVTGWFRPASSGETRGRVTLHDGEREWLIDMGGSGGGPILVVQQFLDAGYVTQMPPTRMRERRRLEVENLSPSGPESTFSLTLVQARSTSCSVGGTLPRLTVIDPPVVSAGERAGLDLLIEPNDYEVPRVCSGEVKLGPVWYPFSFAYIGRLRAPLPLGYPVVLPPDGGVVIEMRHDWTEPLWLSWPRLERRDAGLELVADWDEFYLPGGQSLTVFVRQTRNPADWPNAVLVDGNVPGGTARFPIEPR